MSQAEKNYFNATRITMIAIFSALSGLLYLFGFPISVAFPSFLELNFSDIPALIGTFALGPVSGGIIIFVKILLKLVIKGTSTAFVGELGDLLIGLAFVLPAGFVYKKKHTLKGALVALASGAAASVAAAILTNWLILVPFYVRFSFGGSWAPLIGVMTPLFPNCTQENFYGFYLWVSVLPFNVLRCLIASAVTLLVYKRISRVINRMKEKLAPKTEPSPEEAQKKRLGTIAVCAAVVLVLIAVALLRFFLWE